jgi:diaminopimelate decarboxylase
VRGDLPPAIAAAIERCAEPSLVFDLARIEARARAIAEAAATAGVTPLLAAKAFPRPEVRAIAARWLGGFDVASPGELAEVRALGRVPVISIADPTGRAAAAAAAAAGACARLIVSCETPEQAIAAPRWAEIAVRISASATGSDPAVGAVQDGTGHRRSRFGLDVDPPRARGAIAELVRAAAGRPVGLHVHHGPVSATSGARFAASARAALAAAATAGLAPRFLDLGGAWHAVPDLPAALAAVRAAVPTSIELLIEPGRALSAEAGFATGRVVVARELDDRALRVVDLSRVCHLRWSAIELVGRAAPPPAPRALFVGPTCFEDDVIGEWAPTPPVAAGDRVTLRHVTGYAVAWNTGFGGVPPARVVMVE